MFCDVNGIDAQFRQGGYLWTATTPTQLGAWDDTVELVERSARRVFERLTPEEIARRTGSDVHLAGVLDPSAATVHPGFLVRGLRRVALARGVRIHEGTRVTDLDRRSPAVLRNAARRRDRGARRARHERLGREPARAAHAARRDLERHRDDARRSRERLEGSAGRAASRSPTRSS